MPTLAIPQPQVSNSVDVRLQKDQLEHADVLEELVGQFRDVLQILHRRFFELGVFSQIMRELNSGDFYVEGSDRFDDYRVHQVSDEQFRRELPRYCEIVGLSTDGKSFAKVLRDKLNAALDEADANFPTNDSIEFVDEELIAALVGLLMD